MSQPQPRVLAFGFLLMLINRVAGLVLPYSAKILVDTVIGRGRWELLPSLIWVVVGATILQSGTSFSLTQIVSRAAQRMIVNLRCRVQSHIGRLSLAYHDSTKTGQIVSRIMNDVEGLRTLVDTGMINFFGNLLTAVLSATILIRISPMLTAIAVGIFLLFGLTLRKAFSLIRPIVRARPRIVAEIMGRLTESLAGMRVVKGYYAERREDKVFSEGLMRLLANVLKTLTASSLMNSSASLLLGFTSALVMYFGAHQIQAHHMTIGSFFAFTMYLGMLVAPVAQFVGIGMQFSEAMAGLERTRDILNEPPEEADPRRIVEIGPVKGSVEFDHVCFGYEPEKPVLFDVSFHATPGTVTALVGPSGAGKSTIIGLIAAFYRPGTGRILLDGVDLSTVKLGSYRTQLGVVLQETFLFDGSIRENVAFSRPDATEAEILSACRIARVDEFAEQFELRYETVIGERGVKLSGGQRQRVSIARALLANPRILILDEATSSLDSDSEAFVQQGLYELMRGRTTFVIAHRLSTIRKADQILILEKGRIIERGTHASLCEARQRYFEMYTRQHGVASNIFLAVGE